MSEIVGIGVDMIEISRVLAAYSKESFRKLSFHGRRAAAYCSQRSSCGNDLCCKRSCRESDGYGIYGNFTDRDQYIA